VKKFKDELMVTNKHQSSFSSFFLEENCLSLQENYLSMFSHQMTHLSDLVFYSACGLFTLDPSFPFATVLMDELVFSWLLINCVMDVEKIVKRQQNS
jgi:hypothetical protein